MRGEGAWALLLAVALALTACPEGPAPPPPPAPAKVATLASVTGAVSLERAGLAPAAARPGPLYAADVLVTGASSRAVLRSLEGRELELGEDTRFRIGEVLGRVNLEVQQGTISILGGDEGGELAITTRYGRTALSPGARGTLSIGDGGLAFDVRMGTITFVEEDGGARTAGAGQRFALAMGAISISEVEGPDAGAPAPARPSSVRFAAEQGAPQLRGPKEPRFRKAKPEPEEVPPGTAFALPAGARARVSTDRAALRLAGGARGTVGAAQQRGEQATLALGLEAGAGILSFRGGDSAVELGGASVRATRAAAVALEKTPRGLSVDVLLGEVEVTAAGKAQRLSAGQAAALGKAGAEVSDRPRPALLLPLGRTSRVYGAQGEVGLALPAEAVRVEVAGDAAFKDPLFAGEAADLLVVPAPAQGELHWRLLDAAGAVTQEGHARFRPDASAVAGGGTGSEVVSETGLKATLYYQGQLPSLTFAFEPQPGAKKYKLKVFRAGELKTAVIEREVGEPRCAVESGALGEGQYVWYAAALAEGGAELGGGAMNKFDIVYDNELTTLSITSPAPREKASAATRASGVAPLKSKLFVNGKAAPLDEHGRFSVPVGRVDAVTFRLVTGDGVESLWVRRLRR